MRFYVAKIVFIIYKYYFIFSNETSQKVYFGMKTHVSTSDCVKICTFLFSMFQNGIHFHYTSLKRKFPIYILAHIIPWSGVKSFHSF